VAQAPGGADVSAPGGTLAELRWGWGSAYVFTRDGGLVRAVRRDGRGELVANSAGQAARMVAADYRARPVSRQAAP
jgi:hypothetical protein